MFIKKIESQCLLDFYATYECEHCGHEDEMGGYDDAHFHQNVVPNMECKNCGKKAPAEFRPLAPKYPEGMQT
jgi:transcription elongation factor Elf1